MGQPRAGGRKKPIVLSSDDEGDSVKATLRQNTRRRVLQSQDANPRNNSNAPVVAKPSPSESTLSPDDSQKSLSQRTSRSSQQSSQVRDKKVKSKGKTVYSFFNSATQRQQTRKAESSPERVHKLGAQDEDLIVDDSINDELVKLSEAASGPSHSLTMRKRTRTAFEDSGLAGSDGVLGGSQKFRKTADGGKVSTVISQVTEQSEDDQRPWTEKYGPVNLDELAVHKKKIADVRGWLDGVFTGTSLKRLLVLRGAAGTAKTTTMSLLSKELGFDISEWRNPIGSDFSEEGYVSTAAQFEDFIGRIGNFASLTLVGTQPEAEASYIESAGDGTNQVVLIEEFPNTFIRSSSAIRSFRSTIQQYLAANAPLSGALYPTQNNSVQRVTPIIMIVSETLLSTHTTSADSFTAHRLLGPEILTHPSVSVIEFNAIAPTILTKALELVVLKEARKTGRRRTPGPQVISQLASVGDVRSAVSSLEFLCVRGDSDNGWGSKVAFTKSKGRSKGTPLTKMERESLEMITHRESKLGVFHAVGKVVYNKRETPTATDTPPPQPPPHLMQHARPKIPETDVDTLMNDLGTDTHTFIAALHENYVLSCASRTSEETLNSINGCIDALSDSDLLSPDRFGIAGSAKRSFQGSSADTLRQDEISYQVSVRGLLLHLPFPVKRVALPVQVAGRQTGGGKGDAYRMFYPASLKLWRQREEIEGLIDRWVNRARRGELLRGTRRLNSAARYAKPGGVETWRRDAGFGGALTPKSSGPSGTSTEEDVTIESSALMTSGASARMEVLLERLPYLALMQRRRTGSSSGRNLRDIEKVTKFGGIGVLGDAEVDDEESDPPAETSLRKDSLQTEDSLSVKGVAGLVLSDDDIEDD